jgi:hypothetical protein
MSIRGVYVIGSVILVTLLLLLSTFSHADRPSEMYPVPDDFYRNKWCRDHSGARDIKTADGTNADCVTSTHVVEFQFAPKWSEAIGRALYYSFETGKKAGIVLIIKDEKGLDDWNRLNLVIERFKLPIDTWKME